MFIAHPSCGGGKRAPPFSFDIPPHPRAPTFYHPGRTHVPLCGGGCRICSLQPADEYLLVLLNDPKLNSLAGCNYVCCFFKGTHYYILQCSPLMCFSFALRHVLEPGWEKNNRYTLLIYSRNLYLLLLFLRSKGFLLFDKYLLLICCFLCAQFITKNVARPHGARKLLLESKSPCVKPALKN